MLNPVAENTTEPDKRQPLWTGNSKTDAFSLHLDRHTLHPFGFSVRCSGLSNTSTSKERKLQSGLVMGNRNAYNDHTVMAKGTLTFITFVLQF